MCDSQLTTLVTSPAPPPRDAAMRRWRVCYQPLHLVVCDTHECCRGSLAYFFQYYLISRALIYMKRFSVGLVTVSSSSKPAYITASSPTCHPLALGVHPPARAAHEGEPRSEGCDVEGRALPAATEAGGGGGGVGAQQAEVLQQHTDLRVEVLCGELGVDWWTASRWAQVLGAADCLVATPMIILDALRHGYLRVGPAPLLRCVPGVGNTDIPVCNPALSKNI